MESLKIGSGWEKKCIVGSAIGLNNLHMFSIRSDHQRIVPFRRKVHTSYDGIGSEGKIQAEEAIHCCILHNISSGFDVFRIDRERFSGRGNADFRIAGRGSDGSLL